MTRTPDEIKKALECCTVNVKKSACTDCGHCPYYFVSAHCDTIMHKDVLEYIQQLEADNAKVRAQRDAACLKNRCIETVRTKEE